MFQAWKVSFGSACPLSPPRSGVINANMIILHVHQSLGILYTKLMLYPTLSYLSCVSDQVSTVEPASARRKDQNLQHACLEMLVTDRGKRGSPKRPGLMLQRKHGSSTTSAMWQRLSDESSLKLRPGNRAECDPGTYPCVNHHVSRITCGN